MAELIFKKMLDDGLTKGKIPRATRKAVKWFQRKARRTITSPREIWQNRERHKLYTQRRRLLGNMYFFFYDAEGKDTLPYWDAFPLVVPIELTDDGFLGLNFHYLEHRGRAILMDRLLELELKKDDPADRSEQSEAGKLDFRKIQYNRLSSITRYKYFRPCLKRYKFANMKSRMIQLSKEEWDMALFLPLEKFQKQKKSTVWTKSKEQISRL